MGWGVNSLYPTDVKFVDLSAEDAEWAADALQPIGFYVGGTGGDITITTIRGTTVTIPVAANSFHPIPISKITRATTTATPIYALFG